MEIHLKNIGRRFNRDWIFRNVSYSFNKGESYAILGRNGSGKSTMLQIIAGSLSPSEGVVDVKASGNQIDGDDFYQSISIAAPYLELIEEFSLGEMIDFHFGFKPYVKGLNKESILDLLELKTSRNKAIKYFSSGMKQRTKLALAMCSDTDVLLLDEPASNLDAEAIKWYRQLIVNYTRDKLLIVCSNQQQEYEFCNHELLISDYK
jgi:ABC-type multidrug transport system ATPase subunit